MFGGARGVDTDALEYISMTQPNSVRTVVVPNRLIDQPASARVIIEQHATRVIELGNSGYDRYQIRNQYMVDNSDHVKAFYDFRGRGGTYNTIQYAEKTGKSYSVQPLYDSDLNNCYKMSPEEFQEFVKTAHDFDVPLSSIKGLILDYLNHKKSILPPDYVLEFGLLKLHIQEGGIKRLLE